MLNVCGLRDFGAGVRVSRGLAVDGEGRVGKNFNYSGRFNYSGGGLRLILEFKI